MNARRSPTAAAVIVLVVLGLVGGCSNGSDKQSGMAIDTQVVPSSNGDSCVDPKGDLDVGKIDDPAVLATLAGVDLTEASARPDGDVLDVRLTTAGPINLVPNATFVVAQGSPFQPLSYELRMTNLSGSWQTVLVTWSQAEQRKTLDVTPVVSDNRLGVSVPLAELPPIASLLMFGAAAEAPGGKTVVDECSSLTPAAPATSATTAATTTTPTTAAGR